MENKLKIITHNASFHADDVLACAILSIYLDQLNQDHQIIRSRDPEVIKDGNYVIDVGGIYDPSTNRFDHHQTDGAGKRENGIPYASSGLIWKHIGIILCDHNEKLHFKIDNELICGIDANDNGFDIVKSLYENVYSATLPLSFMVEKPTWQERGDELLSDSFTRAFNIAKNFFKRYLAVQMSSVIAEKEIIDTYEKAEDKRIVVFEQNYERFNFIQTLTKLPEIIFYVYPDQSGTWTAETVPLKDGSFEKRKEFPNTWGGLRDGELVEKSGVADAIFCHHRHFMCKALSQEGALALAEKALIM